MISIVTPTYQRANCIKKLFESLELQTNKCFEWIVVDDGSKDNTKEVIDHMKAFSTFEINYYYKENEGKCMALNLAFKVAKYDYILIVDSDDWLKKNAVELIKKYLHLFDDDSVGAISFFREYSDGKLNGKFFKKDVFKSNYINVRLNSKDGWNDKAEVYRKSALLEFEFPKFYNEKFLAENIVWIPFSYKYDMYFVNESIYVGEYLLEGLTKNVFKNKYNNPYGAMEVAKLYMGKKFTFVNKVKGSILYTYYSKLVYKTYKESFAKSNHKILYILTYIPYILYSKILNKKSKY